MGITYFIALKQQFHRNKKEVIIFKQCNKCLEVKDNDEFYSQKKINSKGETYIYYRPDCKKCTKSSAHKWQIENRERYYEIKAKHLSIKENYQKGRVQSRRATKKYRNSGRKKEWDRSNKDKLRKYAKRRKMHKKHKISQDEWINCKKYFNNSCAYCGICYEKHRDKHNKDFCKEHVYNEGANDLSNNVPACVLCNSEKWMRDYGEWYTEENPKFDIQRKNKIDKWLKEDYKNFIELK